MDPTPPAQAPTVTQATDPAGTVAARTEVLTGRSGAAIKPLWPTVPGYAILRELGRGGMGVVYEAMDLELRRPVALKMVLAGANADPAELRRFRAEAESVARLHHPNIVQVFAVGEANVGAAGRHTPFYAMEFVAGGTLNARTGHQPQPFGEAAELVMTLARALAHAHARGVVHRDLKPANILLAAADGSPKVTDFGLAFRAGDVDATQTIRGTPAYMAPEQGVRSADAVSPAVDIYALGAVLYELLSGRPPFEGTDPVDTLLRARLLEPLPPSYWRADVPRDLQTVCLKCIEKQPARRYASADALADDLRRFLGGEAIHARPVGPVEKALKWARRSPVVAGLSAGLLAAVAVGVGVGVGVWQWREAVQARDAALTAKAAAARSEASARKQAARLLHDQGRRLLDGNEVAEGLVWLAESLRTAPDDDADFIALVRASLAHWLPRAPRLLYEFPCDANIRGFAAQPAGHLAAVGEESGAVRLFDATTGEPAGQPLLHPACPQALAFSPDGTLLAVGLADKAGTEHLNRAVVVWDVAARRPLGPPLPHDGELNSVAFSPAGTLLATGGTDAHVRLWDVRAGRLVWRVARPKQVTAVAFHPDGSSVLVGEGTWWESSTVRNDAVRLAAADGRLLGPPWPHGGRISGVAYTPDGRLAVTGCTDWLARVWDATAAAPRATMSHPDQALAVAVRADGRQVLTASQDGRARPFEVDTGASAGPALHHPAHLTSVVYADGGKLAVAAGTSDRLVRGWALPLVPTARAVATDPDPPRPVVVSPDGRRVVVTRLAGEGKHTEAARTVTLHDAATGRPLAPPVRHFGEVRAVNYQPDGRGWATAGSDGFVRLFDTDGRPTHSPVPVGNYVSALAYTADGSALAVGDFDGAIRVYDVRAGRWCGPTMFQQGIVLALAFSPDGGRLIAGMTGEFGYAAHARLWDVAAGMPLGEPMPHGGWVVRVSFSPDGRRVLTGSHDHTARVWDGRTAVPVGEPIRYGGNRGGELFTPDSAFVVTAGGDGAARRWDAETGAAAGPAAAGVFRPDLLAVSPAGRWVALGDSTGAVRLWCVRTGQPVGPPLPHAARLLTARFAADDRTLVTTADDGAVRVWPLPAPLAGSPDAVAADIARITGRAWDAHGAAAKLTPDAWRARRAAGPPAERHAVAAVQAWHRAELVAARRDGAAYAANWHLDRLAAEQWYRAVERVRDDVAASRVALADAPSADRRAWLLSRAAEATAADDPTAAGWLAECPGNPTAELEVRIAGRRVADELLAGFDPVARVRRGTARWAAGNAVAAEADLSAARCEGSATRVAWRIELLCHLQRGDVAGFNALLADLWRLMPADTRDPRDVFSVAWAACLLPESRLDRAALLAATREVVARLPKFCAPWLTGDNMEAALLVRLGRDTEALGRYDALAANPARTVGAADHAFRAMALARLGRTAEARAALTRAKPPAGNSRPAVEARILYEEASRIVPE